MCLVSCTDIQPISKNRPREHSRNASSPPPLTGIVVWTRIVWTRPTASALDYCKGLLLSPCSCVPPPTRSIQLSQSSWRAFSNAGCHLETPWSPETQAAASPASSGSLFLPLGLGRGCFPGPWAGLPRHSLPATSPVREAPDTLATDRKSVV